VSSLSSAFAGLLRSQGDVEAEEIAAECARPGCVRIANLRHRDQATITGTVHSIAIPPRAKAPEIRVELYDGTGIVELIWLGRRSIAGISPGSYLTVRGRVAYDETTDRLLIFNPSYDLLPLRA
jgi:hypothetical protein